MYSILALTIGYTFLYRTFCSDYLQIRNENTFTDDLGVDELDMKEVIMAFEDVCILLILVLID